MGGEKQRNAESQTEKEERQIEKKAVGTQRHRKQTIDKQKTKGIQYERRSLTKEARKKGRKEQMKK